LENVIENGDLFFKRPWGTPLPLRTRLSISLLKVCDEITQDIGIFICISEMPPWLVVQPNTVIFREAV
jgi:hypothetical protein